ncbi:hypothetical protein HHI36_015897 [Cryptolaemus montrouzieri]|uniref:Retrotransposon gag domain-containing protein n=1 Tax=Cryptolaemus montrouzieri TaxID=559131 RepID=A0ABD2N7P1_9CUCU
MAQQGNTITESLVEDPVVDGNASDQDSLPDASNFAIDFLKLTYLCTLIPNIFDGTRTSVHEFISNVDNVFHFANPAEHGPLLACVISKISGNAKAQLRDKTFKTWPGLKHLLLQLYADRKHYTTLMEELNTLKQLPNDSVLTFYNNIEKLYTRLINSIPATSTDIKGRTETLRSWHCNDLFSIVILKFRDSLGVAISPLFLMH